MWNRNLNSPWNPADPVDITVVADDDGSGTGQNTECVEGNNEAVIPGVYCQVVGVR